MTYKIINYTCDIMSSKHTNQLAAKTQTLPLSSELPAQAESDKRAVTIGYRG